MRQMGANKEREWTRIRNANGCEWRECDYRLTSGHKQGYGNSHYNGRNGDDWNGAEQAAVGKRV